MHDFHEITCIKNYIIKSVEILSHESIEIKPFSNASIPYGKMAHAMDLQKHEIKRKASTNIKVIEVNVKKASKVIQKK